MRIRVMTAAGALLLAFTSLAAAQQKPADPAPAPEDLTGTIDVGARTESTTGDEARLERYRDLRPGVGSQIVLFKNSDQYLFGFRAENIGYHDQRYAVNYNGGKTKLTGLWDSIPLNY